MDRDSTPEAKEVPRDCIAARSAMALFVGKHANKQGSHGFREHLADCPDCMTLYRQTMSAAANMGRAIREERGEESRQFRHTEMTQRAKRATGEPGRRNRYALRLALLPAAFALLIFLQRALKPPEGMTLHWQGGEVHVGEQRLNKDFPKRALSEKGLYCTTKGNARAQIFADSNPEEVRFDLGIESTLQVIDPKQLEVRLASGELLVFGQARVHTQFGMVELQAGEARLHIEERKFTLECRAGEVRLITPLGAEVLGPGKSLERGS